MNLIIHPVQELYGLLTVPGDKSISHRAVMFAALAEGQSQVRNFLPGGDCRATLGVMRALGVPIEEIDSTTLRIEGRGLAGLQEPARPLDCVNSGTTMRLIAGMLAGQEFFSVLDGSEQLTKRPMGRVVEPLRRMGASIHGRQGGRLAPLAIQGMLLQGIDYALPVASAQVKSAVLLAGLYSNGLAIVRQPGPARDHTERMLAAMGAPIRVLGSVVTSERPQRPLRPLDFAVPGDMSSAAFLLAAGLLAPQSWLTIAGVGVNPTRTGLIDVLREMGADLRLENERTEAGEPVADIVVQHSELRGVEIGGALIRRIDELPVLAVVATQAHGRTIVPRCRRAARQGDRPDCDGSDRAAQDGRTHRGACGWLRRGGPDAIAERAGPEPWRPSIGDGVSIAALIAAGPVLVEEVECIGDSYPGFEAALNRLGVERVEKLAS